MFQVMLWALLFLGLWLYWYLAEDFEQSANQPWMSESRQAQAESLRRLEELDSQDK